MKKKIIGSISDFEHWVWSGCKRMMYNYKQRNPIEGSDLWFGSYMTLVTSLEVGLSQWHQRSIKGKLLPPSPRIEIYFWVETRHCQLLLKLIQLGQATSLPKDCLSRDWFNLSHTKEIGGVNSPLMR